MERVQSGVTPDLLVLDIPRGDADGLHILRWMRRLRPELPIVLIGDNADSARKQEAMRLGARDYLARPVEPQQLECAIKEHLFAAADNAPTDLTSDDVEQIGSGSFFIGTSPVMRKLRSQAELLAEINVPVLIMGESGSGKETTARLIHQLSVRSGFGFAKVNCAALPSDLLQAELFGSERNGNGLPKPGKLELCDKGTILLDEITEMSITLQTKLLQVLQTRQFVRPGGVTPVDVDVRIVASSTTSVEPALSENKLSEELYYHLSAYSIQVPPLRQRRDEIPSLLRHFMHRVARHYGLTPRSFSPAVLAACQAYTWPGNLRELENFVKRYLMAGGQELSLGGNTLGPQQVETEEFPAVMSPRAVHTLASRTAPVAVPAQNSDSLKSLVQSVKLEAEKNAIAAALEKTGWNRKAAARLLKVSYRTLLYKIEQYQMRASDTAVFPAGNGVRNNGTH
jgi:DNA-binding NtrC family response regulator